MLTSVDHVGAVKKAAGKLTRNQGLVPRGEAGKVRNKAVTVTDRSASLLTLNFVRRLELSPSAARHHRAQLEVMDMS